MFLNCFSDILTTRKPPSSSTSVFSTNSPARCMIQGGTTISLPGWYFLEGDSRGRSWGHNFFGFYLVRQNSHNYVILLWKFTFIHVRDLSLVWRFVLREKITTHYCTPMYLLGHYVFFISIYSFASSLSSFLVICSLIHSLNYSLARSPALPHSPQIWNDCTFIRQGQEAWSSRSLALKPWPLPLALIWT